MKFRPESWLDLLRPLEVCRMLAIITGAAYVGAWAMIVVAWCSR